MEDVERLITATGLAIADRLMETTGFSATIVEETETPKHPSEGFEQPLAITST